MKHLIFFDTDAATSQVADEVTFALRRLVGVVSTEILTAVGTGPGFCIIVETAGDHDAEIAVAIDRGLAGFAEHLRAVAHRTYRKVG